MRGRRVRLRDAIREGDTFSRLGGDEFALVVEEFRDRAALERIAAKMSALIVEPFDGEGRTLSVGASIGIAMREAVTAQAGSAAHADALVDPPADPLVNAPERSFKAADAAMYAAKGLGRDYVPR